MSSQVLDPNWGCFPLAKFSHHTGPYGTKTHTWTHINYRNDLDFVLNEVRIVDEYGCHETRSWLKVNGGSEVLESQDLTTLVQYCKEFNSSSGVEHPVEVVIKSPFLAMKYPKTAQTVRRFQIKFRQEADFTKATNILKSLGLPVVDKAHPMPIPSTISPVPSVISMTSTSSTGLSLPDHASRIKFGMETPRASSGASVASPENPGFIIPNRPESVPFPDRRMTLGLPFSNPNNLGSFSNTSTITSPHPITHISRMASYHEAPSKPSIYFTQMEREDRRMSHPAFPISTAEATDTIASTLSVTSQIPKIQKEPSDCVDSTTGLLTQSPFFSPRKEEPPMQSTPNSLQMLNQQSYLIKRPLSTSAQLVDIQNLWIPPRRELPFPKPRDQMPVESSPVLKLPPLPEPTPISKYDPLKRPASTSSVSTVLPAKNPVTKKRIAQRKPTAKVVEKPESLVDATETSKISTRVQEIVSSPLASKSAAIISRPSSAAPGLVSKVAAPAKKRAAPARPSSVNKRAKMVHQGTQTSQTPMPSQPLAAIKSNIANPDTHSLPPASPPEEFLNDLDTFITRHKARPAPKELWEAPGYASANEEQREMMLNEFIVENLGNQDFIQLCKDMEFSWRRIGLGL